MAPSTDGTRERLLQAAGRIFGRRGYRQASVREICAEAGANVAAIKYHFGSKEGLYRELLLGTHRALRDAEPLPRLEEADSPEAALRAWVGFALRFLLLRRGPHPFAGSLIARELQEPTAALTALVREVMHPVRLELERTLGALLGAADRPEARRRLANFVLGLCVFHEIGRPVLERFGTPPPRRAPQVEELADAITAFALGGLRAGARKRTS